MSPALGGGVKPHIELRSAIALAGDMLEPSSIEFGDDANSQLQEFILVRRQHNPKNREQRRQLTF